MSRRFDPPTSEHDPPVRTYIAVLAAGWPHDNVAGVPLGTVVAATLGQARWTAARRWPAAARHMILYRASRARAELVGRALAADGWRDALTNGDSDAPTA